MEVWDRARLDDFVAGHYDDPAGVMGTIRRWLDRGDGAAVYRNHDLGSPSAGEPRIVSYGSPDAQLTMELPPDRLPDGIPAGAINWRFGLEAICRDGKGQQ